ncbi:glycoside hydrolase family 3 protein [Nonomuraea roseoviolacea]|uniref:beta-N-acetylhexosaminidase n=1 Tax=Nonomuraea roseoviolacea subsp. carminata TaxID=160689 RepID=A0ABT1JX36_9ACTN|nr:glycoside hydrolase family 3 protein [Nonomuraea roseoviolacea]MCP2345801.1 beta-N-acetylhexosaminidase [Nonomuraea roseoviolacea subsp. carminata]
MSGRIGMAGLLVFALTACGGGGTAGAAPGTRAPVTPTAPAVPTAQDTTGQDTPAATTSAAVPSRVPAANGDVSRVLARMSVEEKVGQLFMPVLYGTSADSVSGENQARYGAQTPAKVIAKYHLGGVILFPANVTSVSQVVALTNGLQAASPRVPLIIGTDQENGLVSRMGALMTKFPGASTVGATGDPARSRAVAKATGEELRALGVNLDFAPVADVNVNPKNPVIGRRAYGDDPAKVAAMVSGAVKGFGDAGVASSAKHFPGHGDTDVDSHTGLPVIKHTRAQWERIDAPPFRAAVAAGVDAVMSAHIVFPKLDPSGDPATLSRPILTGMLREKLGFKGVVSTDALNMEGVRKKYGDGEVAVRAVLAGADLLLMPNDLPKAYTAVTAAVKSGRISRARLDQSVTRLLTLRQKRGFLRAAPRASASEAAGVLRSAEHRRLAARVTREGS